MSRLDEHSEMTDISENRGRVTKDIVNQAPNQLAVVGVIGDPHVVLSGVHAKLQVGFTQAPTRGTVVLLKEVRSKYDQ